MILFSRFGNYGRCANQLFQYASLHSIAKKNNTTLQLPSWSYAKYFTAEFPEQKEEVVIDKHIQEPAYHYIPEFYDSLDYSKNIDITAYLQSEKYFNESVKDLFQFQPWFIEQVKAKINLPPNKKNIVLQIRRTDYINNPVYFQLPITFYITALLDHFPNYENCNIIFVSDGLDYCRTHFECLPNAFYVDGFNDIEQICLMSLCDGFVIANSTFGWFGAWLAEQQREVKIIHSGKLFDGKMAENNDSKDFYPFRWKLHQTHKIDLTQTTFTVPCFHDHNDRKKNMDLSICLLQRDFDTNVIIGEQGSDKFPYMQEWCKYVKFDYEDFHRTRMLNEMAKKATTPVIANFDCDVIIPPMQVYLTVQAILKGADMVYPYDGRFARMDRNRLFKTLEQNLDIGIATGQVFPGMEEDAAISVGGAVFFNRDSFFCGGGENENFISFGAEDVEREIRFKRLGFKVERIGGCLYHLNHWVGENSCLRHKHVERNTKEIQHCLGLSKEYYQMYVMSWDWYAIPVFNDSSKKT